MLAVVMTNVTRKHTMSFVVEANAKSDSDPPLSKYQSF
jgi:hypothetical protein